MKQKIFWVYMLHCSNDSFYTGYTNDLAKRFQCHIAGTACKYTRSFKPIKIAQSWEVHGDKAQAMKIERVIKKLSRAQKKSLIEKPSLLSELLR